MSFTENLRKIITKAKGTLKIQRFTGGEQRAALRAPLLHSSGSIRRILFAVAFSCTSFRSSGKSAWDFHSLLRSLPSCARLSRARTMSLHRRLIPFRVRVPFHLSKKKNSACSTLFFFLRRTRDSNPRGRINTGFWEFKTGEIPFIPFLMNFRCLLPHLEDRLRRRPIQYSSCSHMTLQLILCHL